MLVEECAALPKPPPPRYEEVEDRTVDASLTPELVAQCKRGCEILCSALLKAAQWTMGRSKVFLKDMALDQIVALFRTYHAMRIMAWWKMAKQRRIFRRFKRAVERCQKVRAAAAATVAMPLLTRYVPHSFPSRALSLPRSCTAAS